MSDGNKGGGGAFSNGVSAKHLIFLALFLAIRHGGFALGSASHQVPADGTLPELRESGKASEEEGVPGEEEEHGYQVFHVEFERVQLPFIISLWIFVSSLAKIGKPESIMNLALYVHPTLRH